MPSYLANLQTIRDGYVQALADDAASPKQDYSLDGETTSRDKWRESLQKLVREYNVMIEEASGTIIITRQVVR